MPPAKDGQDSAGSGTWQDDGAPFSAYSGQAAQEQDWPEPDHDPWRGPRWPDETAPGGDATPEPPAGGRHDLGLAVVAAVEDHQPRRR